MGKLSSIIDNERNMAMSPKYWKKRVCNIQRQKMKPILLLNIEGKNKPKNVVTNNLRSHSLMFRKRKLQVLI